MWTVSGATPTPVRSRLIDTLVLTATVVVGALITIPARSFVLVQLEPDAADTAVRASRVLTVLLTATVLLETFVDVDTGLLVAAELEAWRAGALSTAVAGYAVVGAVAVVCGASVLSATGAAVGL